MSTTSVNYRKNCRLSDVLLVTHVSEGFLFTRILAVRRQLGFKDAKGCKTRFRMELVLRESRKPLASPKTSGVVWLRDLLTKIKAVSIFAEHQGRNLRRGDSEDFAPFVRLSSDRTDFRSLQRLGLIPLVDFLGKLESSAVIDELLLQAALTRAGIAGKQRKRQHSKLAA